MPISCLLTIDCCFCNRVERIFLEISNSIEQGSLAITLNLKKLQLVVSRFTALTGLLVCLLKSVTSFFFLFFYFFVGRR